MTHVELALTFFPGDSRFVIGPSAISTAIERIRAEGKLDQTSIPELIAAFPLIPSDADIDFAKWYVQWTDSGSRQTASCPASLFDKDKW